MKFSTTMTAALLAGASLAYTSEEISFTDKSNEPVYTQNPLPAEYLRGDLHSRGTIRMPRRRPRQPGPESQPEILPTRKGNRKFDWRDYNPDQYGGVDPYAHCVFPEDTAHLDSPEY